MNRVQPDEEGSENIYNESSSFDKSHDVQLEDSASKIKAKKRYYLPSEDDEKDMTDIQLDGIDKNYRSDSSIDLIKESSRSQLRNN